nr:hypothetical protein [Nanoarchaeum sp.]
MSEELEIQKVDTKKIKDFWKKYHLTIIVLLLIPLFIASYYRAYSYDLPIIDEWAKDTVTQGIQNQIGSNILKEYPNIDETTYNNLVSQQTNLYISQNKDIFNTQVKDVHKQLKEYYQDNKSSTYLLGIDEYFYYREAENVVNYGHVGNEFINGEPVDSYMVAPKGEPLEDNLHPFFTAYLYKFISIFDSDTTVKDVIFFVPLLIATLSVIPAFFIARKVSGNVGGLVAALLVAISQAYFVRTAAGAPDTDAYNVFFPLMIAWMFLESFSTTYEHKKKKIILALIGGVISGLFAFTWPGWWYIFDFIIGSIVIYLIFLAIKYKKSMFKEVRTKNALITAAAYILSSAFFVTIMTSFESVIEAIKGPISVTIIKEAAKSTLWPNVYNTVAELGETSLARTIDSLGGKILFVLAILGIVLLFLKKNKKQSEIKYGIFLTLWFIGTLYSTTKGIRFAMYMVPVHAIAVGIFAGMTYNLLTEKISKGLEINKKLISIILIIVLFFLFLSPLKSLENTAKAEVPMFDDSWYDSLNNIKETTAKDAILTSWWDFGHWFKAYADRAVTFDGASQNTPQAHWVGKVLMTSDEDEAMGILRMLNCGANDAYDILLEQVEDPLLAKKILDEALPLNDKEEARKVLAEHIGNPDDVLDKMFCEQREQYFITSEDMVSKGGVWAHFGSWDFEKAYAYNTIKQNTKEDSIRILQEKLNYSKEEAESTYRQVNGLSDKLGDQWISPYPSYAGDGACSEINSTLYCNNGVIIDLENNKASVNTNSGKLDLKYYRTDTDLYVQENGSEELAVAYIPSQNKAVLMDPKLIDSMFTKLFYYDGEGLDHFELYTHERGLNQFDIYVWKVIW